MKFLISIVLTVILAFALGLFLDWWSIAIAAFVASLFIPQHPWRAFVAGFLALLLLWGGYSFFINQRNGGLLASKIASVLPLSGNIGLLLFVTALVAGLVGGFASLSASFLRKPVDA
jgi:ABC-type antimicrobial peptide transport system permease subunit